MLGKMHLFRIHNLYVTFIRRRSNNLSGGFLFASFCKTDFKSAGAPPLFFRKKNPQYVSIATNFTNSQVITNCNDIFSRINSPFPCSPWTLVHWCLESYSSVACATANRTGAMHVPLIPYRRPACLHCRARRRRSPVWARGALAARAAVPMQQAAGTLGTYPCRPTRDAVTRGAADTSAA